MTQEPTAEGIWVPGSIAAGIWGVGPGLCWGGQLLTRPVLVAE